MRMTASASLANPAVAIEYTREECVGIERVLKGYAIVLAPKVFTRCGVASTYVGGPDFKQLQGKYPDEWGTQLNCRENQNGKTSCDEGPVWKPLRDLCQEICAHKITPVEALSRYWPRTKP